MASINNEKLRQALLLCLSAAASAGVSATDAVQGAKPADASAETPATPVNDAGQDANASAPATKKPASKKKAVAGQVSRPPSARWNEDFSSFADPANRKGLLAPLKFVPLGSSGAYVSFGGDYRITYVDFFDNPNWGLNGLDKDSYFQNRAMVHADWHFGDHVRLFTQLGSTHTWSKEGSVSTTDQDKTDLAQAFLDLSGKVAGSPFTLRVGRQELELGSSRVIGVRDAPNTRRSFDGVRAMFKLGSTDVSAFYTNAVLLGPDNWDDKTDHTNAFSGIYTTTPLGRSGLNLDAYALDYQRDKATYSGKSGEENRKNLGLRLFGSIGNWDFNEEGMYQFGDFADDDIKAWGIATETGFTFDDVPLQPRIGARYDIATGDKNKADGEVNTFNPLYPRNSWYTLASLSSWSNIRSIDPLVSIQPFKGGKLIVEADELWRYSANDAVYLANMVVAPRTTANTETRIGTAWKGEFDWAPASFPNFTLVAQYVYFKADDAVLKAGGANTHFIEAYGAFRF